MFGTSHCLTIADTASDTSWRIVFWRPSGNESQMRAIEPATSVVCRLLKTRWPVSAADHALRIDSGSRISPITRMSGACRTAALVMQVDANRPSDGSRNDASAMPVAWNCLAA